MEIDSLSEIQSCIEDLVTYPVGNTLLVLDIDQTTIRAPQMWGSEPWYHYLIESHKKNGLSEHDAIIAANAEWETAQQVIDPVPMEEDTVRLLRAWQQLPRQIMALTARSPAMVFRTDEQLTRLDISFESSGPGPRSLMLDETIIYARGILFVGPLNNKGLCFRRFLETAKLRPRHLFYVDDLAEHIVSMEEQARAMNISYSGFRFRAADKYATAFNLEIAAQQAR